MLALGLVSPLSWVTVHKEGGRCDVLDALDELIWALAITIGDI